MTLSQITLENVKQAARIDFDYDDLIIEQIMGAAKSYLLNITARSIEELDEIPEMVHAFYALCIDMYDNRSGMTDNIKENPTVKQIVAMHRRNYL